jgi:hypothetical protein
MNVLRACALSTLLVIAASAVAQEPVVPAPEPTDDPAAVLRYDPFSKQLIAVPQNEIKPGYVYNRFSAPLNRRVWSIAGADGEFLYAMAPGSVQAAWQLDLRASRERQMQELIAQAPELARMMDDRGARAYVRLDENDAWQLVPRITIASVYDLETLRRYEWHGQRRVNIVSSTGYEWLQSDGEFVPATYEAFYPASPWRQPGEFCCW